MAKDTLVEGEKEKVMPYCFDFLHNKCIVFRYSSKVKRGFEDLGTVLEKVVSSLQVRSSFMSVTPCSFFPYEVYCAPMPIQAEFVSRVVSRAGDFVWRHKVPTLIAGGLLSLTYAASFLGESRRIDPSSIPGTPQPTPGLDGSGGGGESLEALSTDSLSDWASDGCVSIGGLPEGRHTTYSALMELSARSGWPFPGNDKVFLKHRLGDKDNPTSVIAALDENKIVFNADSWCPFEP